MASGKRDMDPKEMAVAVYGLTTASDKIRALYRAGYRQSDIAKFLKVRDQFVSSVVRTMKARGLREEAPAFVPPSVADDQ